MITNEARCTQEIKSMIVMAKAAFYRKKTLFTSKLDSNSRKKTITFGAQIFMVLKLGHFEK
jgi:hypothetical protein